MVVVVGDGRDNEEKATQKGKNESPMTPEERRLFLSTLLPKSGPHPRGTDQCNDCARIDYFWIVTNRHLSLEKIEIKRFNPLRTSDNFFQNGNLFGAIQPFYLITDTITAYFLAFLFLMLDPLAVLPHKDLQCSLHQQD